MLPDDDFERLFDRFEAICWLEYTHRTSSEAEAFPISVGRFASTMMGGSVFNKTFDKPPSQSGAYNTLWLEAKREGAKWAPVAAGLFGGRIERFHEVGKLLEVEIQKAWR